LKTESENKANEEIVKNISEKKY